MRLIYLMIIPFILIFNGCSSKEAKVEIQEKDKFIQAPYYDFQIIDIDGAKIPIYFAYLESPTIRIGVNAYKKKVPNYEIRLTPKDVYQVCKPYLEKSKGFYRGVTDFYEFQIKEYNKIKGETIGNN